MKVSSWWWDFADRCDMKVSRWALALFLVSAPVPMCGSAYADGCGRVNCKSEDSLDQSAPPAASRSTAPAPNRSAPVGLLTPEPTADTCGGSGCKDDSDDNVGTDDIDDNTGTALATARRCRRRLFETGAAAQTVKADT